MSLPRMCCRSKQTDAYLLAIGRKMCNYDRAGRANVNVVILVVSRMGSV
jgi:hypothetical protein